MPKCRNIPCYKGEFHYVMNKPGWTQSFFFCLPCGECKGTGNIPPKGKRLSCTAGPSTVCMDKAHGGNGDDPRKDKLDN